jgi:hypothetical protein
MLKVGKPLEILKDYGFTHGTYGESWWYDFGNFSLLINGYDVKKCCFLCDNVVRIYYSDDDLAAGIDFVEGLEEIPDVLYKLIKDGVVVVC